MTKRTFITKSGDQYEWEETPEVLEALKQLHQSESQKQPQSVSSN